jgi:aspartate/methionine/tyrosine aminotransferase
MSLRIAERMRGIERTLIRQIFDSAPPDAINLGLGQPDLPTPDVNALAGITGIVEGRTSYSSTAGDPGLREEVARAYSPFASGAENVVITVGSQEAVFAACLSLLDPSDELLYPDPGYPAYPVIAQLLGARPRPYPLRASRRFRLDPADVFDRLNERTRAVILCAPSNPTGAMIDRDDLAELSGGLERRGVPWLSDEIYAGFAYDEPFVSPSSFSAEGGLVISGLSKDAGMTGWRIGWVVGPPETVSRITAAHQYLVTCASSVSQAAARAAFSPRGRAERGRYLEIFRRRREVMGEELSRIPDLSYSRPDGAFYYFVDVSRYGDSLELAREILKRRKVVTVPGEAFGANGKGWLRLSYACSEQGIREGVRRIAEELKTG